MIALAMSASRVAAVIGNIIFPVVLESGCLQTFLVFGSTALGIQCNCDVVFIFNKQLIISVSGLLALLLPNTHLKNLE